MCLGCIYTIIYIILAYCHLSSNMVMNTITNDGVTVVTPLTSVGLGVDCVDAVTVTASFCPELQCELTCSSTN